MTRKTYWVVTRMWVMNTFSNNLKENWYASLGCYWTTSPQWTFSQTKNCSQTSKRYQCGWRFYPQAEPARLTKLTTSMGTVWVWYHGEGITNILSLARVKSKFRITYDSHEDNTFHIFQNGAKIRSYRESPRWLYYSDVREKVDGVVCVNTVRYNKYKHSHQTYLRALNARIL